MSHETISLIAEPLFGGVFGKGVGYLIGDIKYTATKQQEESGILYSFRNKSHDGASIGIGFNIKNWYGSSVYLSNNIGIGRSLQITPWFTCTLELSVFEGITVSGGIIREDITEEISANVGLVSLALVYVMGSYGLVALSYLFGKAAAA